MRLFQGTIDLPVHTNPGLCSAREARGFIFSSMDFEVSVGRLVPRSKMELARRASWFLPREKQAADRFCIIGRIISTVFSRQQLSPARPKAETNGQYEQMLPRIFPHPSIILATSKFRLATNEAVNILIVIHRKYHFQ